MYIYICMYVCIYMYVYMKDERRTLTSVLTWQVSYHNAENVGILYFTLYAKYVLLSYVTARKTGDNNRKRFFLTGEQALASYQSEKFTSQNHSQS